MNEEILVVGGAGYIGSHMCKYLHENGMRPVVLDNLSQGHRWAVRWGPLYEGEMDDPAVLREIVQAHDIRAAMHFAAFCYVGESVREPLKYYQNNIASTLGLLSFLLERNIDKFIFSSSCATYGEPQTLPIPEEHPQRPINPYGRTKLMMETILDDLDAAQSLRSVCLRYFNAAGADPDGEVGEDHDPETHLIPLVLQTALGLRGPLSVFGDDYDTPDGTCVRDYIHVVDLAQAHFAALRALLAGGESRRYNLGNGNGYSVLEVIETAKKITRAEIPFTYHPRRPGDPAALIGSAEKAIRELDWRPRFATLEAILQTAWDWHVKHHSSQRENNEGGE